MLNGEKVKGQSKGQRSTMSWTYTFFFIGSLVKREVLEVNVAILSFKQGHFAEETGRNNFTAAVHCCDCTHGKSSRAAASCLGLSRSWIPSLYISM